MEKKIGLNMPDMKSEETKSVTRREVQAFVDNNIASFKKKEIEGKDFFVDSACVDGRTGPSDSQGRVRMFGGDAGISLSFAATLNEKGVDVDNHKLNSALLDAKEEISGKDAKLCLHTDEHGKEKGAIGCGHANRASSADMNYNGDGKYGLSSGDAKDIFEDLWERDEAEHVVLKGEHDEKGVLLVHGLTHSVNSLDTESGDSYFVIDVDATKKYFEAIVPRISKLLDIEITSEEVLKNYSKQLEISAGLLAGHLNTFDVYFDSEGAARVEESPIN